MTKTISLSDDAYDALAAAKRPGESFSEVARRLAHLAALEDVFDPTFRLEGDPAAWTREVRAARKQDKRPRMDLG
jgi:hypothetical protein